MRTLLLMRHAKSSWDNPAMSDHERPLNDRGQLSAPLMGEWLRAQKLVPDLIVCSDARRTRETADLLAPACGFRDKVVITPELYLATVPTWRKVLRSLPGTAHRVLCIGHNPGLEELLHEATGRLQEMKTASIAQLDLDLPHWEEWDENQAPLQGHAKVTRVRDIAQDFGLD